MTNTEIMKFNKMSITTTLYLSMSTWCASINNFEHFRRELLELTIKTFSLFIPCEQFSQNLLVLTTGNYVLFLHKSSPILLQLATFEKWRPLVPA